MIKIISAKDTSSNAGETASISSRSIKKIVVKPHPSQIGGLINLSSSSKLVICTFTLFTETVNVCCLFNTTAYVIDQSG